VSGLLDFRAVLAMEGQHDKLLIHLAATPGSEGAVLHQVTSALANFQPCQGLDVVLDIDSTSKIHRTKRSLEDKR
jgi:hypothetical protein